MTDSQPVRPMVSDPADALERAEAILARARADCAAAGASPLGCAELMLQEALLAMMVHGLAEYECTARFNRFGEDTVASWFAMAARSAERCDCALEQRRDLHDWPGIAVDTVVGPGDGGPTRLYRRVASKHGKATSLQRQLNRPEGAPRR